MSCVTLGGNYKGCISSLKEASLDDSDQNNKHYMTKSNLSVYDFDKVKAQYSTALGMSTRPKSVDALSSSTNGDIYLNEFKNGNLSDKVKKLEIRQKIYDSLIMLYDLLGIDLVRSRHEVVFVLVYNQRKNNSRVKIANAVSRKANSSFAINGLNGLQGFCLKEMKTVTEAEFNKDVLPLLV